MKIHLLTVILSLVAFTLAPSQGRTAEVDLAAMPASLICAAPKAKVQNVRAFKITKLDQGTTEETQPESTFRMGFQEMSEDEGMVTVSFSDECEGWYAVYFKESGLRDLKNGTISRLTGELEYDDLGEFFPGHPDDGSNGHDRTDVFCKLAKTSKIPSRYN